MVHPKLSFFVVVPMLITLGAFIADLNAQDTETNRAIVQEFVEKAEELVEQEKIEEAIKLYERIVKAAPDDFESYIKLANFMRLKVMKLQLLRTIKKHLYSNTVTKKSISDSQNTSFSTRTWQLLKMH